MIIHLIRHNKKHNGNGDGNRRRRLGQAGWTAEHANSPSCSDPTDGALEGVPVRRQNKINKQDIIIIIIIIVIIIMILMMIIIIIIMIRIKLIMTHTHTHTNDNINNTRINTVN